MVSFKTIVTATAMATVLAGCGAGEKLDRIGQQPPLSEVHNPKAASGYKPVTWPLPDQQIAYKKNSNSLWQPGSRAFFKDQRAGTVGDIVKVMVDIRDEATFDNKNDRTRETKDELGAPSVFGLENILFGWLPGKAQPSALLSIDSTNELKADAKTEREERITTEVAALVTQVLPNGNLVISGKQEVRVNFDIREITVEGVIRPEDIKADNTIESAQIAEARISYAGRGQGMDSQQPRYGTQIIDAVSPF